MKLQSIPLPWLFPITEDPQCTTGGYMFYWKRGVGPEKGNETGKVRWNPSNNHESFSIQNIKTTYHFFDTALCSSPLSCLKVHKNEQILFPVLDRKTSNKKQKKEHVHCPHDLLAINILQSFIPYIHSKSIYSKNVWAIRCTFPSFSYWGTC